MPRNIFKIISISVVTMVVASVNAENSSLNNITWQNKVNSIHGKLTRLESSFAGKIGVLFVPAHLAEQVVSTAEFIVRRDKYAFEVIKSGKYSSGQLDSEWTSAMKDDFIIWMEKHPEEGKMTRAELDVIMSKRTW